MKTGKTEKNEQLDNSKFRTIICNNPRKPNDWIFRKEIPDYAESENKKRKNDG